MKTLRMRSSSMQHVGSFMGPNMRTLFRRCNKPASERKGQWNPYTRGSENLPKKVWKKAFRRAWIVYNAIVGQLFRHFRKIAKTCSERKGQWILTRVVQMIIQAIIHMIIQMIVLGTQNRCFSKGFCAEGSLHRTRGRNRCKLYSNSQSVVATWVGILSKCPFAAAPSAARFSTS